MIRDDATIVTVRRQWSSYLSADYLLDDVDDLHWSDVTGGINVRTPRPFIHGYVLCTQMIRGDLDHSCAHGPPPHRIKVCLVKVDNKRLWPQILEAMRLGRRLRS